MGTPISQTSRDLHAAAADCCRRAKEEEDNELSIAAQIAALEMQREDVLRRKEEHRLHHEANMEAAVKQLFAEQREDRQQKFELELSDHVIKGIKEAAAIDEHLLASINAIASDSASSDDIKTLQAGVFCELVRSGADSVQKIAKRIAEQSTDDDKRITDEYSSSKLEELPAVDNTDPSELSLVGIEDSGLTKALEPAGDAQYATAMNGGLGSNASNPTKSLSLNYAEPTKSWMRDTTTVQEFLSLSQVLPFEVRARVPDKVTKPGEDGTQAQEARSPTSSLVSGSEVLRGRSSSISLNDKRTRNDGSAESRNSSTPNPKRVRKARTQTVHDPLKQFEDRLQEVHSAGGSVKAELECSACAEPVNIPRLSQCLHLYCNKCLFNARKRDATCTGVTSGTLCNNDLKCRATTVKDEQIHDLILKFRTQTPAKNTIKSGAQDKRSGKDVKNEPVDDFVTSEA